MLIFIIVYFIIGLALELIIEGKHILKDVEKYGVLDTIAGTIILSFITPVLLVYDMLQSRTHQRTNKES